MDASSKEASSLTLKFASELISAKKSSGSANANEKTGSLTLLLPDRNTQLARISFFNLGICRLSPERTGANTIRRIKAELYCEQMEFKVG